jgi:Na+-translocating ferredoxin:NAD+ oxidoreductase RnfG subunit
MILDRRYCFGGRLSESKPTHINERTTVPLFAVIGAALTGVAAYGGILIFVTSIGTKSDLAEAKNLQQDQRLDNIVTSIREQRQMLLEIKASASRSEGILEVLMQDRDKGKR